MPPSPPAPPAAPPGGHRWIVPGARGSPRSSSSCWSRPSGAGAGPAVRAAAVGWPPSTLVVSEVQTGGASASDEFVELANQGAGAGRPGRARGRLRHGVGIDGDAQGDLGDRDDPRARAAVADRERRRASSPPWPMSTYSGGFAATGGAIALRVVGGATDRCGRLGRRDNAFVEGAAAAAPPAGSSLERAPGRPRRERHRHERQRGDWFVQAAPSPQGLAAPPVPAPDPRRPRRPRRRRRHADADARRRRRRRRRRRPHRRRRRPRRPRAQPTPDADADADPDAHARRRRRRPLRRRPDPDAHADAGPRPIAEARALPDGTAVTIAGRPDDARSARSNRAAAGSSRTPPAGSRSTSMRRSIGSWPAGTTVTVDGTLDSRFSQRTLRVAESRSSCSGPTGLPAAVALATGAAGEPSKAGGSASAGTIIGAPDELTDGLGRDARRWLRPGPGGHRPGGARRSDARVGDDRRRSAARSASATAPGRARPATGSTRRWPASSSWRPPPTPTPTPARRRPRRHADARRRPPTPAPTATPTADRRADRDATTPSPTPAPTSAVDRPLAASGRCRSGRPVRDERRRRSPRPAGSGRRPCSRSAMRPAGLVVHLPADSADVRARDARLEVTGKLAAPYGQLEIRPAEADIRVVGTGACPRRCRRRRPVSANRSRAASSPSTGRLDAKPKKASRRRPHASSSNGTAARRSRSWPTPRAGSSRLAQGRRDVPGHRRRRPAGDPVGRPRRLPDLAPRCRGRRRGRRGPAPSASPARRARRRPATGAPSATVSIARALKITRPCRRDRGDRHGAGRPCSTRAGGGSSSRTRSAAIELLLPTGTAAPPVGTRVRAEGRIGVAYGAPRLRVDRARGRRAAGPCRRRSSCTARPARRTSGGSSRSPAGS